MCNNFTRSVDVNKQKCSNTSTKFGRKIGMGPQMNDLTKEVLQK